MWRLPICGGNWNNESNAGVAALNLNNPRSNVNNNIGFRPALLGCKKPAPYGVQENARKKRSRTPPRTRGNINRTRRPVGERRPSPNPPKDNMRTVNGIWASVIDYASLYESYKKASRGKRYTYESMKFRANLEENLIQIQNELIWKTYQPSPLRVFTIHEPKERTISAPTFRDRVVHHSLVSAIEPAFERRFISDTFACRVGKGTHQSMYRMREFSKSARREWGSYWILKCDIRKFFPSVRHDILKATIRRTIFDRDALWLIDTIIDSAGDSRAGIPIGALTSQLFANVYLDPLDHYVKDDLGIKHYVRYMDDFVIIGKGKHELRETLCGISAFLSMDRSLALNHRTGIWPAKHGIDFCGYRIWPTHVKPRKRTIKTAKRRLRAISRRYPSPDAFADARAMLMSFLGYMKHCSAWRSTEAVLERAAYRPKGDQ